MNWGKRLINMLKYSCSALACIILIYPLIGIAAYILRLFQSKINWKIMDTIDCPLTNPPALLPVSFDSFTIDLVPLFIIVIAGIYGWVTTSDNQ